MPDKHKRFRAKNKIQNYAAKLRKAMLEYDPTAIAIVRERLGLNQELEKAIIPDLQLPPTEEGLEQTPPPEVKPVPRAPRGPVPDWVRIGKPPEGALPPNELTYLNGLLGKVVDLGSQTFMHYWQRWAQEERVADWNQMDETARGDFWIRKRKALEKEDYDAWEKDDEQEDMKQFRKQRGLKRKDMNDYWTDFS